MMCPFKYYLEYVLGIRKGDSYATSTGTIVHSSMEDIAEGKTDGWERRYLKRWIEKKPHTLHKDWPHKWSNDDPDFRILQEIDLYLDNWEEILSCTDKKSPLWLVSEGAQLVRGVLARPYNPFSGKVVGVEKKFKLEIGGGVKITGFIDLVTEIDEKEKVLCITDWKTGGWVPSYEESREDPQMKIYDLAASILWPEYKTILLTFDYLKKCEYTFSIEQGEREKNRQWIIDIAKEIDACTEPKRISSKPSSFWKCKNLCSPSDCDANWKG